jgi:DNA-directed RNA polymerase specialized sigma24 family protein
MVLPEEDADALVRRFVAGHPDAISQIMCRYYEKMTVMANRLIHNYLIDEALLDRDDAVNLTLFKLWRAAREGQIGSIVSRDDFWKLFSSSLQRNILHARDHGARLKRGGRGTSLAGWDSPQVAAAVSSAASRSGFHRREAIPDDLRSDLLPPDVLTLANEEVERLLGLLHDPLLKSVATMRAQGYTTEEIAHHLGLTTRSIRRKLAEIRRIWAQGRIGAQFSLSR